MHKAKRNWLCRYWEVRLYWKALAWDMRTLHRVDLAKRPGRGLRGWEVGCCLACHVRVVVRVEAVEQKDEMMCGLSLGFFVAE